MPRAGGRSGHRSTHCAGGACRVGRVPRGDTPLAYSLAVSDERVLTRTRLPELDAFRGFTVAAMLLVNDPGTWSAIWWPLEHAEWHGWTPTDLIFPFFLFIVGITTEL